MRVVLVPVVAAVTRRVHGSPGGIQTLPGARTTGKQGGEGEAASESEEQAEAGFRGVLHTGEAAEAGEENPVTRTGFDRAGDEPL